MRFVDLEEGWVQRGNPELPTEIEDADFFAIKYGTALGVIVIEPAGNGGIDLVASTV